LRGKFKKIYELKKDKTYALDIAAVGDIVEFEIGSQDIGVITKVYERKNYISRQAPRIKGAGFRGERLEQIIAANVDQVFVIASANNPKFNNRFVDRAIVCCESSAVVPIIIINKIDIGDSEEIEFWKTLYEEIGYEVLLTSAAKVIGIDELKSKLKDKTSVFFGQSGVGKSSLLNAIDPSLNLKVGEISDYNLKGKHTTVTARLIELSDSTRAIDTPGVRELNPYGISSSDLSHYFIEFEKFLQNCKYKPCLHNNEPECAVRSAAGNGIAYYRYDSYLNLLYSLLEEEENKY